MTEFLDPCEEIDVPERPDPRAPGANPVQPQNLEIPDEAFPVREPDPIEQTTIRDSAIIEKYLWNNLDFSKLLRYPEQAVRLQIWQERPIFLDTFRFVAGKNWYFHNGNLKFQNTQFRATSDLALPFSIELRYTESTADFFEKSTVSIIRQLELFQEMVNANNRYNVNVNSTIAAAKGFHSYLFGLNGFNVPIISDFATRKRSSWKHDFSFKAPAAFFKSEVEQSSVPLIENVSITPHYIGLPVEDVPASAKEINKQGLYRYVDNSINPLKVENDNIQMFIENLSVINEHATNSELNDARFQSPQGQQILNNHVRITLNTKSKIENRDHSFCDIIYGENLQIHFMNFLINSDIEIDSKNRFVQILDQSKLGGNRNNKQVVNYQPKSYEIEDITGVMGDNFDEHYDFNIEELLVPITDETYSKSPIYYNREEIEAFAEISTLIGRVFERFITLKKMKQRGLVQILSGQTAHCEIVAYRIEKSDINGNVIQNFYFFNKYENETIDFIDTQVFHNRQYTYRIYAINMVVGSIYQYQKLDEEDAIIADPEYFMDPDNAYRFDVHNKTVVSFIETPYFEQQLFMIDKPPMYPQVDVVPFFQNAEKIGFRLTQAYGSVTEKPIAIIPEDAQKIAAMQANSPIMQEQPASDRLVHYFSDNPPTEYEVLIIDHEPFSYSDFANARRVVRESNYNSGYIELNLESNIKYYLIFRSIDLAGISNPSPVYTLTLNSHPDGVYIEFDEYEMFPEDLIEPMTFERVLKIDPSPEQMSVDFSEHIHEEDFYSSAPRVSSLQLGIEEERVWTKDYKFRLKSRTSGKAIDLNAKYGYKIIDPGPPLSIPDPLENMGKRRPPGEISADNEAEQISRRPGDLSDRRPELDDDGPSAGAEDPPPSVYTPPDYTENFRNEDEDEGEEMVVKKGPASAAEQVARRSGILGRATQENVEPLLDEEAVRRARRGARRNSGDDGY